VRHDLVLLILKSAETTRRPPSYNQTTIAYDATKEEKVEALKAKKAVVEERHREGP
jgi:hypothetical protein